MNKLSCLFCVLVLFLSSCATIPSTSQFARKNISLGMNREQAVRVLGRPFMESSFKENDRAVCVLSYKEPARVKNVGFIITTTLTFENDYLVSVIQKDKQVSEFEVITDTASLRP